MHASSTDETASALTRPLGRYGQLETDAFCSACGYNLHGQDVLLDERLGFLICRCPECGRFSPAGAGTSANSVWLSRFGSVLLLGWIVIVLGVTVSLGFALGGMQVGFVESYLWYESQPKVGFAGSWAYTTQPPAGTDPRNLPGEGLAILLCAAALAIGFVAGLLCVTFMWHWPRRRYLLLILLPVAAVAFVLSIFLTEPSYRFVQAWCVQGAFTMLACESLGILLGIRFGRPLARVIIRSIVPPRPRQLLAFLWHVDGKRLPGADSAAVMSAPVETSDVGSATATSTTIA